ncbi:MAG: protein phosphatase 2C domain-containing protein [Oscillospiraceae bacterium]|jgi:serine/threonine protein phosphatase PrpC|nr:protein phosphatase 2C domain-containing protein [Oscillospiraceae bacterium]
MLTHATLTRQGGRTYNEDHLNIVENGAGSLFLLADGLGGHGRGREASDAIVGKACEVYLAGPRAVLDECFQKSQDFLMAEQIRLNAQNEMKSTFVILWISGGMAYSGHIGDSRLYHFRKNRLQFRSLDHSVPQMLVASGEIKEKDIRGHEDRNRLLRVMGMEWNTPKYELHPSVKTAPGDSFLLCSDGLWEWIDEKMMIKTLKAAKTPAQWLENMERTILANGEGHNMDNYSAIAVWIR